MLEGPCAIRVRGTLGATRCRSTVLHPVSKPIRATGGDGAQGRSTVLRPDAGGGPVASECRAPSEQRDAVVRYYTQFRGLSVQPGGVEGRGVVPYYGQAVSAAACCARGARVAPLLEVNATAKGVHFEFKVGSHLGKAVQTADGGADDCYRWLGFSASSRGGNRSHAARPDWESETCELAIAGLFGVAKAGRQPGCQTQVEGWTASPCGALTRYSMPFSSSHRVQTGTLGGG
ncbi:hypothetical protein SAMN05444680_12546 [Variovorax sp. YR216]|nr:hypothetical protein SAMN05444680_12546 [Variovorax sp. YR216]